MDKFSPNQSPILSQQTTMPQSNFLCHSRILPVLFPYSAKLYLLRRRSSFRHFSWKSHEQFHTPLLSSLVGDEQAKEVEAFDFPINGAEDGFNFDDSYASSDLNKRFKSPGVQVMELEDLPEQWRRSRLAWLCKELPAHRSSTFTRVLNAQRKWIRQDDCTYIAVHCMRIRENEASFKVYKWMLQQHWFRFDFALATKLADFMGKEGKYLKCQEVFNDIINQGLIPDEYTFHVLIVAYLSSSASNALDQACSLYNSMISLGGYQPRLSLHTSLFKALVSRTGTSSKPYLKHAEFIFNNLKTYRLQIHSDVYGGLIWLHSYQDVIDTERIAFLRGEMKSAGIKESVQLLVSILRACSKAGDLMEAEKTWTNILSCNEEPPTQAFVYLMEIYSKIGNPRKSLEIFRSMQKGRSPTIVTFYKIIEVLCRAQEIELAESLLLEFINSGMKPLVRSFADLMYMYSNLNSHDKVQSTFLLCLEKCRPNQTVFSSYLDSLVQIGDLDKAEEIFNQMHSDEAIGANKKSCNTLLRGYLTRGNHMKTEKLYEWMCVKKFDVESSLMEELEYVLSLRQEEVKNPVRLTLSKEQREILVGLLLGGLSIEQNEACHIQFLFKESSIIHSFLKRHVYSQFREWLDCTGKLVDDGDSVPWRFATISHSYFKFYADQFCPQGQPVIPNLIHRWMTPRVLAYWYMYGGYRTTSGDILLKLMLRKEDVLRIVKILKTMSLDCLVKRKGPVYWIGLLGTNALKFWKLTESFVLMDLKEPLQARMPSTDQISVIDDANHRYEFDSDRKLSDSDSNDDAP